MQVNVYNTRKREDKIVLVKEKSVIYEGELLNDPSSVADFMRKKFNLHLMAEEYVYMIAANSVFRPLGVFEISHGSVNATIMGPREIFQRALLCGAVNLLLVHNHPGESTEFSKEDVAVTKRIKEAGDMLGVPLVDHIVVAGESFRSAKAMKLVF